MKVKRMEGPQPRDLSAATSSVRQGSSHLFDFAEDAGVHSGFATIHLAPAMTPSLRCYLQPVIRGYSGK
jgi:hypothetical protein